MLIESLCIITVGILFLVSSILWNMSCFCYLLDPINQDITESLAWTCMSTLPVQIQNLDLDLHCLYTSWYPWDLMKCWSSSHIYYIIYFHDKILHVSRPVLSSFKQLYMSGFWVYTLEAVSTELTSVNITVVLLSWVTCKPLPWGWCMILLLLFFFPSRVGDTRWWMAQYATTAMTGMRTLSLWPCRE